MIDVHRAVSVMGFLPPTDPIKRCSFHEQLILYSIVIELRHKQQEFLTFGALTQRYFSICDQYSVQQASWTELSTIVQQLIQSRLLIGTNFSTSSCSLNSQISSSNPYSDWSHAKNTIILYIGRSNFGSASKRK